MGCSWFHVSEGHTPSVVLHYARDHRASAEILYGLGVQHLDSAAFLGHLSLELALKAFLAHACGKYPGWHKLVRLHKLAVENGLQFDEVYVAVLEAFDRQHTLRYPAPGQSPGAAQGDLGPLKEVFDMLESQLPESVRMAPDSSGARGKDGRKIIRSRADLFS